MGVIARSLWGLNIYYPEYTGFTIYDFAYHSELACWTQVDATIHTITYFEKNSWRI